MSLLQSSQGTDGLKLTLSDQQGNTVELEPKSEAQFNESWENALAFTQKVAEELRPYRSGPGDFQALINLIVHLT